MSKGFTLIELVVVLVVFGIIAAMGSSFVVTSITAYNQAAERNKLVERSRAVVERISRQLRIALPYSLRVSASGNCIEFMQLTGGANYEGILPDSSNGAAATSSILVSAFELSLGAGVHLAVGAMHASEIYTTSAIASRATIASLAGAPISQINLSQPHTFLRNSINSRAYVMDSPERFCVSAGQMLHYSNYGLDTGTLGDSAPMGDSAVMSDDVSAIAPVFSLSPATESRNTLVAIQFALSRQGETMNIQHQVQVRNVP
ncbi:prepilin-type N-terminal cleavage/methylation domain-containing protein [Simiduia curdlanivorans]|uniref:Type II secretion system protein J n=1 Tax=Simiduia curdlanivorans TaxID=1492769 RepID=A0ABV8V4E0_9GAMM|nr:prepilin-type N-terminal cleavage/methylation domain-containing protein [Simiduia curdlanivorans]MDN3640174.1 prepilin-type N-terminal cleavage/methylation domain-containing protein [Simiduia curdlanivorans]